MNNSKIRENITAFNEQNPQDPFIRIIESKNLLSIHIYCDQTVQLECKDIHIINNSSCRLKNPSSRITHIVLKECSVNLKSLVSKAILKKFINLQFIELFHSGQIRMESEELNLYGRKHMVKCISRHNEKYCNHKHENCYPRIFMFSNCLCRSIIESVKC